MTTPACAEVAELSHELALGALSGPERAAAVAHVERCPDCQSLLAELTQAADFVLAAAPEAEPPSGFESRVLARMAKQQSRRPARRWLAAAAVLLLLALAVVVTAVVSGGDEDRLTARLEDGRGRPAGEVSIYGDDPSWLLVTVEGGPAGDRYELELELTNGEVISAPARWIEQGEGSWGRALEVDPSSVRSVRLVGSSGWSCTATFDDA